jgi:hypothetical protein
MAIKDAIYYAGQVEKTSGLPQSQVLDSINSTVSALWNAQEPPTGPSYIESDAPRCKGQGYHWPMWEPQECSGKEYEWRTNFLALAVQGALTLYLKHKFDNESYRLAHKQGRGLLHYAVVPQLLHTMLQYSYGDFLGVDQSELGNTEL